MALVTVNGRQIEVPADYTVLQACEEAGVEIPRFCYHERLEVAGNCRMCLVKVEKMPKPVASCAQPITEGMVITTNSPEVKAAREGVMEFLLINHPLDCPICDQAGECDLQDQSLKYGKGISRFEEHKRAVEDKYMGPLIKTHMTRCIHCTRCVRFLEDIAGTNELGAVGRGEDMQITTYVEKSITSELSGNIIDLCPVGALTSRPYAFKARSWELKSTQSIDVLDAVGSHIRVDSRGLEVMRVLPRLCEEINEEWISDKTRFAYDGLRYQRLDTPMIKQAGRWKESSWNKAISYLHHKITNSTPTKIGAIAGDLTDVETMYAAKFLLNALGSGNYDCRQDGAHVSNHQRVDYIFNTTIAGIEEADFCLIIGSNPRCEAAIINARIRKAQVQKGLQIGLIGSKVDLNYDYQYFGDTPWLLKQMADGAHPFCQTLSGFKRPMLILGSGALRRDDAEAIVYHAKKLAFKYKFDGSEGWNGFNMLQHCASRVGGLDIGFVPEQNSLNTAQMITQPMDLLFLLGADECNFEQLNKQSTVVYIGHHGDRGAQHANLVLPAPAYTEKSGLYVNTEGRVASTMAAVLPLGEAKPEWQIFSELAMSMDIEMPRSLEQLRAHIVAKHPHFALPNITQRYILQEPVQKGVSFSLDKFTNIIDNFYMTDPISRASKTMAECTKTIMKQVA
jgi:NADH-quinone oxidoreductase subunit G